MPINVTYHANYNGFSFDGIDDNSLTMLVTEIVCDQLIDECDEDGYFYGSRTDATTFIINEVQKVFSNVEVDVTFDTYST